MKLLAIDTSTQACSAALLNQTQITNQYQLAARQQAQLILPMIHHLLNQAGLALQDLDALAFANGPGSFTGVRLAVGVMQGLAFTTGLPVISVSSLAVMAQRAYRELQQAEVLVVLDAHMEEVYWAEYAFDDHQSMQVINQDQLAKPQEIAGSLIKADFAVGDAFAKYPSLQQQLNISTAKTPWYPDAVSLLDVAVEQFKQQHFTDIHNILPNYLRDASAWKTLGEQSSCQPS